MVGGDRSTEDGLEQGWGMGQSGRTVDKDTLKRAEVNVRESANIRDYAEAD